MCETKKCTRCGEIKSLDKFCNCKSKPDGKNDTCNDCIKIYNKKNEKIIKEKKKIYDQEHKEETKVYNKIYSKKYYKDNKEYVLENQIVYYEENKEVRNEYQRIYNQENREARNNYLKVYNKERRINDPLFKTYCCIRNQIYSSLKKNEVVKLKRTEEILGCTVEFFKSYIESQFEDWMSWENHGIYVKGEFKAGWDIDHIIPISSAITEQELLELNHYSNFQPLCSKTNRDIKRNNINYIKNIA